MCSRGSPCANYPCSTLSRFQYSANHLYGSHRGSDRGILSRDGSGSCNTGSTCDGDHLTPTNECDNPQGRSSTSTASECTSSTSNTTTFSNCSDISSDPTSANRRICTSCTSSRNRRGNSVATNVSWRARCDGTFCIATGGGMLALTSADSSSNGTSSYCSTLKEGRAEGRARRRGC